MKPFRGERMVGFVYRIIFNKNVGESMDLLGNQYKIEYTTGGPFLSKNYPFRNIPPPLNPSPQEYENYMPNNDFEVNDIFNNYGSMIPNHPPNYSPSIDEGILPQSNNYPMDPYYSEPNSGSPNGLSSPIQPVVPKPMRPCKNAPFPPIQEANKYCRFMSPNSDQYYYDPTSKMCRKYTSCLPPSFDPRMNVLRNSFDTYEECLNSCYMTGSCCSRGASSTNLIPDSNLNDKEIEKSFFRCLNGRLIPRSDMCNGIIECSEGEDEMDCFPKTTTPPMFNSSLYFQCSNGAYIKKSYLCDGIAHCTEKEDEQNCSLRRMRPETRKIITLNSRNFDEIVFGNTKTHFVMVYFFAPWCPACNRFKPKYKKVYKDYYKRNITFYDVDLDRDPLFLDRFMIDTFPKILFWNLMLPGSPFEYYKDFGLTSEGFGLWIEKVTKIQSQNYCGLREFPCHGNMQCLPKELVCDYVTNCQDGSDERLCAKNRKSGRNNFNNKKKNRPNVKTTSTTSVTVKTTTTTLVIIKTTPTTSVTIKTTHTSLMDSSKIKKSSTSNPRFTTSTPPPRYSTTTKKRKFIPRRTKAPYTKKPPIITTTLSIRTTTPKRSIVRVTPFVPWAINTTSTENYEYYDGNEILDYGITSSILPINPFIPKTGKNMSIPKKTLNCELKCRDGTCIRFNERCNGIRECSDGVDEQDCGNCKRTQFTCKSNKECIDYMRRCDGESDCEDGSDEQLCEVKCKKTEYICDDGSCINFAKRCNGVYNCADKSDEAFCPSQCNSTIEFACNDGKCIDKALLCDGTPHCHDSTDEISCKSSNNCDGDDEWKCLSGDVCIDKRKRCDGYPDCHDLSDEDIDQCPERDCVFAMDTQIVWDGSDEVDCLSVVCQYWQFKCLLDGVCVDSRRKCDGYNDCNDGSDETNFKLFSNVILDCNVVNPSGKWTYEGQNGRLGTAFKNGSLLIRNFQKEDVGYYTCASSGGNEVSSVYVVLDASSCKKECKDDEFAQRVCGSNGLIYSSLCDLTKASCNLKIKIRPVAMSKCNRLTTSKCAIDERECVNPSGKCIKETSFCDGIPDCEDKGDEKFCFRKDMKSVIIGKNISVAIKNELEPKVVRIKCHLSGENFLWWFRDNLIQSNSAHATDEKGHVLIITDLRKGDAGWYSCRNRAMEEYTTYLNVEYPAIAKGGPAELSFLLLGKEDTKGSLVLDSVTSSKDRGDYTCTPYNLRGTMGPSTKVSVRVRTRFYECPVYCSTEIYDPVCGIDGRTYDNECFLILESCNNIRMKDLYAVHSGRCEKNSYGNMGRPQMTTSTILEILGATTTMVPYMDFNLMETTMLPPLDIFAYPTTTLCATTTETITTKPIYYPWTTSRPYETTQTPLDSDISCKDHEWTCDDGHCIPFVNQCNGVSDCPGGEDEKYCADLKNDFICGDMLIDKSLKKEDDLKWTCPDSDNEYICDDYVVHHNDPFAVANNKSYIFII
ncbi:unnamed protein product [Lepeophtheirus salmonis]|uniref:(salmon louse) hypothetical protein n=1 Tax=Lepeophtheirus salmonis TaxID=72036 RepID=A0A7R8D490_LEPSM|nr:unnamed protein product [Lepeophtheirus salmonis]CAF2971299.1 unnamed protein product [Lepeophtheirus salmonis]